MSGKNKIRLDQALVLLGLAKTRSQANNWIQLGDVIVDGVVIKKSGHMVRLESRIDIKSSAHYVSRAGLKLASVADVFGVDFQGKVVLDVGSSTGGFSDFAIQSGAKKVVAVDVGTDQMDRDLRRHEKIELHEKTDIREFESAGIFDIILCDVSFISLRKILPTVNKKFMQKNTILLPMVKPQFEATPTELNKGVVKNNQIRRKILANFELWIKDLFIIQDKRDSAVAGAKGNLERFYVLRKL